MSRDDVERYAKNSGNTGKTSGQPGKHKKLYDNNENPREAGHGRQKAKSSPQRRRAFRHGRPAQSAQPDKALGSDKVLIEEKNKAAGTRRQSIEKNRPPRKRNRRRGLSVVYIGICAVVMAGAAIYSITNFFIIREIVVSGVNKVSKSEVINASKIETGDNLVFLDSFGAVKDIYDISPYIEKVMIRRHLPVTLEIVVVESLPVAGIRSGDGVWLISEKGRLLEKTEKETPISVTIVENFEVIEPVAGQTVATDEDTRRQTLIDLLKEMNTQDMLSNVSVIDTDKLYDYWFLYKGRLKVHLGIPGDISRKLRFLESMEQELGEEKGSVYFEEERARFVPE